MLRNMSDNVREHLSGASAKVILFSCDRTNVVRVEDVTTPPPCFPIKRDNFSNAGHGTDTQAFLVFSLSSVNPWPVFIDRRKDFLVATRKHIPIDNQRFTYGI